MSSSTPSSSLPLDPEDRFELPAQLPATLPDDPATADELAVTLDAGVATLWLNRPAKRNAVTFAMWQGIGAICEQLGSRSDVRMLVVRGVGDHFCAGADISGLVDMPMADYHRANRRADEALASFPRPTVAHVTGSCIGGGAEIATGCDLRIASDDAVFGITPAKLGILYPTGAVARVTRLIGPSATKHLLYTGEIVDAERALRTGLVDEVHPRAEVEARLAQLCDTIAHQRSLLTQMGSKLAVDAVSEGRVLDPELEAHWLGLVETAGDKAEGIAAFAEKRAPRFTWAP